MCHMSSQSYTYFSAAMFCAEEHPFALDESIQCSNSIVSYIQLNISKSPHVWFN